MANAPLMPKATAVWLVENTSLTFEQIAEFCDLHELEVKGIADGDVAQGIRGMDPVGAGQLSRDEIERGQVDPSYRLKVSEPKVEIPEIKTKKVPKYTPLSRRQDRPSAIAWLIRNHPELRDSEVIKLVGTTKPTIQAIRERTHWNSANIQPQDPVALGLCTQIELDAVVRKAAVRVEREGGEKVGTLRPTAETVGALAPQPRAAPEPAHDEASVFGKRQPAAPAEEEAAIDADQVFAKIAPSERSDAAEPEAAPETAESETPEEAKSDESP